MSKDGLSGLSREGGREENERQLIAQGGDCRGRYRRQICWHGERGKGETSDFRGGDKGAEIKEIVGVREIEER